MRPLAWLWIPALWLLALRWHFGGPFSFSPSLATIPLAAMLGARYGRGALWLVALGGLPLLPVWVRYAHVTVVAAIDVYLIALLVCTWAADERPLAERTPRFRRPALLAVALLLLPFSVSIWGADLPGQNGMGITFIFGALLFFLLFLMGWAGLPAHWVFAGLGLATLTGMWLLSAFPTDGRAIFGGPQAELPFFGTTRLHFVGWGHALDTPAAFLIAIAWFAAGALWARMLRTRTVPVRATYAHGVVVLLALLAFGLLLNRCALAAAGYPPAKLPFYGLVLGSLYAVPLAGLLGGLLLRERGILILVLAVALFWALDPFLLSRFKFPVPTLSAAPQDPLLLIAFGLLGARMREHALGAEPRWPASRWVLAGVLCVAAFGFVFDSGSTEELVLRVLIIPALGALAAAGAAWLRARLGASFRFSIDAWAALLLLVVVAGVLARFGGAIGEFLANVSDSAFIAELWEDILGLHNETFFAAGALLFLGFCLYALEQFLSNVPTLVEDVRTWFRAAGTLPQLASPAVWSPPARVVKWLRNTAFALAALPLLAATTVQLYPRDGIVASLRELAATRPEPPRTSPPVMRPEAKTAANPLLWQAALEAVSGFPLAESDPERGRLVTGWRSEPHGPQVRTKIKLRIGQELSEREVGVELERQRRGLLGIWVQQDTYWDGRAGRFAGSAVPREETERIRKAVFARALALEQKN